MLLWAAAGVPLGVYNIVEDFNVALRIQPQILTTLSLITWAQCLYYRKVSIIACNLATKLIYIYILFLTLVEISRQQMHRCCCLSSLRPWRHRGWLSLCSTGCG